MGGTTERVGIYGGTFSPIHAGHLHAAQTFLDTLALDHLYVIPTAIPPHKANLAGASAAARFDMAALAFADTPAYQDGRLEVSDYEIKREGRSYSVYTLEHFTAPGRELSMLVGTDMFLTLPEWHRASDIFKLAQIVLMRREQSDATEREITRHQRDYQRIYGAKIRIIPAPPLELSSTQLRERLRTGQAVDGLIPDRVINYIKDHHLYKPS